MTVAPLQKECLPGKVNVTIRLYDKRTVYGFLLCYVTSGHARGSSRVFPDITVRKKGVPMIFLSC